MRDRDCTPDEVDLIQEQVTLFARMARNVDQELVKRYLDQTSHQVDGTLDPVLVHSMSITQMRKAQRNLKFFRGILAHMEGMRELTDKALTEEQADNHE